jgi:Meiotically up-regulated gene 113
MSVYFIIDQSERVKIGHSGDPDSRLRALQTSHGDDLSLVRIIDGVGLITERWLHRKFDDQRVNGEWFWFIDEMMTIMPPAEPPNLEEIALAKLGIDRDLIKRMQRVTKRRFAALSVKEKETYQIKQAKNTKRDKKEWDHFYETTGFPRPVGR